MVAPLELADNHSPQTSALPRTSPSTLAQNQVVRLVLLDSPQHDPQALGPLTHTAINRRPVGASPSTLSNIVLGRVCTVIRNGAMARLFASNETPPAALGRG